jgi:hypothetical protein
MMEEPLGKYAACNLPVVSMALLLKVNYYSGNGFLFIAPHCNVRYVSTSRICSMQVIPKLSDKSSSTILLCEETAKSSSNAMTGDCLLFKNDKDDKSNFLFEIQEKSLFPLYCLSINDAPEIKDAEMFQKHYESFEEKYGRGENIADTFYQILTAVGKKYNITNDYETGYNRMYEDMLKMPFLKSKSDFKETKLPDTASTTLKAVFYFQQICPLRITILEGNHRHVFYLSKVLHLSVKPTEKPKTKQRVEVPSNFKVRFYIEKTNVSFAISGIQFIYSIYVAQDKLSTRDIVEKAIALSRNLTEQHRQAVDEEEVHL